MLISLFHTSFVSFWWRVHWLAYEMPMLLKLVF
jgi:hypothetical protein